MKLKSALPRIVLGSIFMLSGLNGFFNFLPEQGLSSGGEAFMRSIQEMGFLWSFIKGVEVLAGMLLLFNVAGQLGVLLLAPICVGIFFFHTFVSVEGATLGWAVIALELIMLYIWRDNFKRIFTKTDEFQEETESNEAVSAIATNNNANNNDTKKKDVDFVQEQEMVANRPDYKRKRDSHVDASQG